MGYTTDFVGHIDIAPVLNEAEMEYLEAFVGSRHFDRPGGPYDLPGNPFGETSEQFGIDRYNRTGPGLPELWCGWQVCSEGCCLSWSGAEKFYRPIPWLQYLLEHFLRPRALASQSDDPQFEDFTFDHVLDGMIVGCRRDTRELFSVTASRNRITSRVLMPGKPEYAAYAPLAYQASIDAENERFMPRGERRRKGSVTAVPNQ